MDKNKDLIAILMANGFEEAEAKIYISLYEIGAQPISVIAKRCKIERTSLYYTINKMLEKSYVLAVPDPAGTRYKTINIEDLMEFMKDEANRDHKKRLEMCDQLEKVNEHLAAISKVQHIDPQIRTYQGPNGLKEIYKKSLESDKIWAYYEPWDEKEYPELREIDDWHTEQRIKKKIPVKLIIPDSEDGLKFASIKKIEKYIKLIKQKDLPFRGVTIITETDFMIYSHKEAIGIIITSPYIAKNQIAIFEYCWGKK